MSAYRPPSLSIIIPAFREVERLPRSLSRLCEFFDEHPYSVEIIAVVEKSRDGTLEAARKQADNDSRITVIGNDEQKGKGFAVRCGMLRADADFVFFMDADLSTSLEEIPRFIERFGQLPQVGIIIGSRALPQSTLTVPQSWLRRSMGAIFNHMARMLGVAETKDTQCGFKAFRKEAAREIFSRQKLDGFAFDVEILLLAKALGYSVDVLPINWENSADSRVNIATDSLRMFIDLLRVRAVVRKTLAKETRSASQIN